MGSSRQHRDQERPALDWMPVCLKVLFDTPLRFRVQVAAQFMRCLKRADGQGARDQ
ncbi:hypothetical protein AC519_0505 [Pseudomonas savastanoi]|nr:hypothetical protein AC519_0505 [Pseudomonas savastanoi]